LQLADSPVVLIHGPRQCGKTTLARLVGDEAGFPCFTFDDDVQRAAASTVTSGDFKGLRKLKDAVQKSFAAGVVLYDGEAVAGFGDRLYAVPITRLWDGH
jgi:cytidylate kinase